MAKTVDQVFNDIIKDWRAITFETIENASNRIQKDILEEAENYLHKYYYNFTPELYDRTYSLKKAMLPYTKHKSTKGNISIEVGVQYRSSALKGAYWSNSKFHQSGDVWKPINAFETFKDRGSDNGIPEPDWILDNFLKGDHGGYQQDNESTNTLMEKFFDKQVPHLIKTYIEDELYKAITKRL